MRRYWQARAEENAVWYVDTSLDYERPDMERFWATGREIARQAYTDAPVHPAARRRAVEIGSGLGRVSRALAAEFDEVVGIDIAPEMVQRARQLVDEPGVRFEVGEGADLAVIDDASADFVMSFTVFQHFTDVSLMEGYISDSARALRPGGVLAVQWNNLPHPLAWKFRGWTWRLEDLVGIRRDRRAQPEFLGTRVPTSTMTRLCRAAGLEVRGTSGEGTLFAWLWARKPDRRG